MRKFAIIIIIVLILAGGIYLRLRTNQKGRKDTTGPVYTVEVTPVTRGDVVRTYELLGTVSAQKTAQVFPETIGRITKILVTEGTYVAKNSKIMSLINETVGFEYKPGFIKSPITGYVAKLLVEPGSMVSPKTPVALIVDFSKVKVSFNVSENDISSINKNTPVEVIASSQPKYPFSARITEISPVVDPLTRTVAIKAIVNNTKRLLKPGMTVRVRLELAKKKNVIRVPSETLLDHHLFVVKDSTAQRRDVIPGLVGNFYTEIVKGISENEMVVVVGQQRLAGGEKVNAIKRSSE